MTTKTALVALANNRILVTGAVAPESLVGRTVTLPTLNANETAEYTIQSVSRNQETGDVAAWVVRAGKDGGHHARIVTSR